MFIMPGFVTNQPKEAAELTPKKKIRELKFRLENGEQVDSSEIIDAVTYSPKESYAEINELLNLWQKAARGAASERK